jgi:cyclic pyranopterin phosphate synthase
VTDPFGRTISYLRVSVTDRCDLRCVYCMSEDMTPPAPSCPRPIADARGARPAVFGLHRQGRAKAAPHRRRAAGPAQSCRWCARCRATSNPGALDELTLTTNGSQLARLCRRACGDTACAASTSRSTRSIPPNSAPSPAGAISTRFWPASRRPRRTAGLAVKINAVALKGVNEDEIPRADGMGARPGHGR